MCASSVRTGRPICWTEQSGRSGRCGAGSCFGGVHTPRAGGFSGPPVAREEQRGGSTPHQQCSSAPRTGKGAHRTAHHHVQIRGSEGGFGVSTSQHQGSYAGPCSAGELRPASRCPIPGHGLRQRCPVAQQRIRADVMALPVDCPSPCGRAAVRIPDRPRRTARPTPPAAKPPSDSLWYGNLTDGRAIRPYEVRFVCSRTPLGFASVAWRVHAPMGG